MTKNKKNYTLFQPVGKEELRKRIERILRARPMNLPELAKDIGITLMSLHRYFNNDESTLYLKNYYILLDWVEANEEQLFDAAPRVFVTHESSEVN